MNTRLEAHKCGLGTLAREELGTIGSGPNNYVDYGRPYNCEPSHRHGLFGVKFMKERVLP